MNQQEISQSIALGKTGSRVFPLGLGCMGMSGMYGPTEEAESIAMIQAAIDQGVTLIDTGDFYGMGHNEMLLGRALEGRRDRVQVSVKFGAMRGRTTPGSASTRGPSPSRTSRPTAEATEGGRHRWYRPSRLD